MPNENNLSQYDEYYMQHPYYQLLKQIQDETMPVETLTDLLNVNLFYIDLDTREIIAPAGYPGFVGVTGEHKSEMITFQCDRYYENVDLASMVIVVEYVNANGEGRVCPIITRDFETFENQILFDWVLDSEITKSAGKVSFDVRFYMVGDADDEIALNRGLVYSLRTKPFESKILNTLPIDSDEIYQEYSNVLAPQFDTLIGLAQSLQQAIDNKKLPWNDLI